LVNNCYHPGRYFRLLFKNIHSLPALFWGGK
jgi:hypothetical protein